MMNERYRGVAVLVAALLVVAVAQAALAAGAPDAGPPPAAPDAGPPPAPAPAAPAKKKVPVIAAGLPVSEDLKPLPLIVQTDAGPILCIMATNGGLAAGLACHWFATPKQERAFKRALGIK